MAFRKRMPGWAMAIAAAFTVAPGSHAAAAAANGDVDRESEKMFVEMADSACGAENFPEFLWSFANSPTVRARYSAPTIQAGVEGSAVAVPAAQYLDRDDFPIVMMDYSYVTGDSQRRFDAPGGGDPAQLVHVEVEFNTASDDRHRVDWVPGRFEPGEGDGPGTLIAATGPGGYLLFHPTADCWQLAGDIRNPAR